MKLKVLFILPVLIVNAIWWAPLAIAVDPAPVGGGELSSTKKAEIDALKAEVKQLEGEVANLKLKYEDANTDLEFKKGVLDDFYKTNVGCTNGTTPVGDPIPKDSNVCNSMYSSADQAVSAAMTDVNVALQNLNAKDIELKAKQAALAAASANSGTNAQGLSNYQSGGTILPDTAYQNISDCEAIMRYVNNHPKPVKEAISSRQATIAGLTVAGKSPSYTDVMGCAIKTGDVKFWMVPYFVRYILEFIIGIAGLASVAGIVYGGYFYLFAGLSDDQQKGKNAIKNSIIALVLSLSAWAIVNIVISLVTSI